MSILIINIKELLQIRNKNVVKVSGEHMKELPRIENAFLHIEDDKIVDFGKMEDYPSNLEATRIDATGKVVLPTWCDSHTHIVYAGHREQEFVDRINGLTYTEIANRGGGILNSATILQNTSEEALYQQSIARVENVIKLGTGAIEIKSGYGLTPEAELKMLRVIKRIKAEFPLEVKATFLGAHAIPNAYKNNKKDYIDLIIKDMLPAIAHEKLANFIDIFCEQGYFDLEDTDKILSAGKSHGLIPKIHVNQFTAFGGVAVGVKHDAISVDHLEVLNDEDIDVLKNSNTIPVALPGCSFFLGIPFTPARKLIDSGLPLALATDYNPGTTPSGNMNFVVSTACIKMNMTPAEAINAATINGAYAMEISENYGSITKEKKANLIITKPIPNYNYLPYAFGENLIETVILNGKVIT